MEKIGILGGTFDPIHIGHLIIANDIIEFLRLDRIIFIPTLVSPFKTKRKHTDYNIRIKMVQSAIKPFKYFTALDTEKNLPIPSFSINTINKLRELYYKSEFYMIIGLDQAKEFNRWKDYKDILKLVKVLVIIRDTDNFNDDRFIIYRGRRLDISSSEIRKRIAENRNYNIFVTPDVYKIIEDEKLYRKNTSY
jgi:nicotinate-nucleotide adenylyltransferase